MIIVNNYFYIEFHIRRDNILFFKGMGDIVDCVQKNCQLEPQTGIEDLEDEDKSEPVVNNKKEEENRGIDNSYNDNIPQSVNDHYYMNSVKDFPMFGEQLSNKEYDE